MSAEPEPASRPAGLVELLHIALHVADELVAASDPDTLCRRAVELARQDFGLDRCSIWLQDGGLAVGSFGTDLEGRTVDERGQSYPSTEAWSVQPTSRPWRLRHGPLHAWRDGRQVEVAQGWTVATLIRARDRVLGVMFNDNAIAHAECDAVVQEVLAVFCAHLGAILEQKRAEAALRAQTEALRQRDDWFSHILRHCPSSVAVLDREMRYLMVSERWLDDYHLAERDIIGQTHYEVFPEIPERWREIHRRCLDGAVERHDQDCFPRADGHTDWVRWEVRPWFESDGAVGGIVMYTEVITGQVEALAAARASEQQQRALIEALPDAVFRFDRECRVLGYHVRPDWELAAEPTAFLGQPLGLFLPPEIVRHTEAAIDAVLARGEAQMLAYDLDLPDGLHHYEAHLSPCGQAEVIALVRDVTARFRLEEQLRQAAKMEAVGKLAGGVAHDFNNLMTTVLGYSELLISSLPAESPLLPDVIQISRAAEQAAALTQQLLAFSRKQTLAPRSVDLGQITADLELMLRRLLGETVELRLLRRSGPALVLADVTQMQQVIVNLAVNARDAMPHGGRLTIEVGLANLAPAEALGALDGRGGPHVRLRVSDTGQGMDEATVQRIFEPFFTTKPLGKGVGLGLATAYGIVEQSGGHIAVRSAAGAGSTFTVWLPAHAAPAAVVTDDRQAGAPRLLLVEADGLLRNLAHRVLADRGYAVTLAENTVEALMLAARPEAAWDLLVLDSELPAASRRELAAALRARQPQLPLLLLASSGDDAAGEDGARLLLKPFAPAELEFAVHAALGPAAA
jgi:PAS domain S-box-containing protein